MVRGAGDGGGDEGACPADCIGGGDAGYSGGMQGGGGNAVEPERDASMPLDSLTHLPPTSGMGSLVPAT